MRVFLMLLIFVIGFSSYSAAAHAFCHDSYNPIMEQANGDSTHKNMDMPDCPGHAVNKDQQKDADQDKNAKKGKCMDCTHCCTSHAVSLSYYSIGFEPPSSNLNPSPFNLSDGDYFFSLLRPPKPLV